MTETVTLRVAHGDHKSGTTFEVIRKGVSTTVVKNPSGGRGILPNSKLSGHVTVTLDITAMEAEHILTPIKDDDSTREIMENLAHLGEDVGPTMEERVENIRDHYTTGGDFRIVSTTETVVDEEVGIRMSTKEREVLKKLMDEDPKCHSDTSTPSPEPEPKKPAPVAGENQILFTDITGGRKPRSGINYVIDVYPDDYFPESIRHDIPEVDKGHFWDTEVLEALVLSYQLDEKACLTGLPGTGKTTSVRQFAAWIRQPYVRLSGRGDLESSSFLGFSWADSIEKDGKHVTVMSFKPGLLTQALDYEGFGYFTTIDEVWKIPPYIQMAMQHLYEKGGHLTLDDKPGTKADKMVHPAKEFRLVLTDNVKGTGDSFDKFAATQMQDSSSLDRININQELSYLAKKQEVKMLMDKYPGANEHGVEKLVQFAGLVRNAYRQGGVALTLSPRGLMAILDMHQIGVPVQRAIQLAFLEKIADEAEQLAVQEMLRTVGIR